MEYINEMIELKAYSTKELSVIYGVCDKTMHKWMKPFHEEIGKKVGRYYTVAQVRVIFERLGMPGVMAG
jgi:hypothetical protein